MRMEQRELNGERLLGMKNRFLEVEIAPGVGGKVVSLRDAATGYDFLWTNKDLPLKRLPVGSEYDPNFYGGIDELIPNDMPETIDGVDAPDHGELWTRAMDWAAEGDRLVLSAVLPRCGLRYRRSISLCPDAPALEIRYKIENPTGERRSFLWKFHAALNIEPGDEILCPAGKAVAADPEWTRWQDCAPFDWPHVQGQRADVVPSRDGTTDFLYLYDLKDGVMGWRRPSGDLAFCYRFDPAVFPYCWYFASYGGFFGHYTAVLEPCTAMPCSVNAASALRQCSVLEPGQKLETRVQICAGSARRVMEMLEGGCAWSGKER